MFSDPRDLATFQKIWDCLIIYYPSLECSIVEEEGGFVIEISGFEESLDTSLLSEVVQSGRPHVREITVIWTRDPKPALNIVIGVSTAPLAPEEFEFFAPTQHPELELQERLQQQAFDVREAPPDFQEVLPFYEATLDCLYSRGVNITTPQVNIMFTPQDATWLSVTNMDHVSYSFLEHLFANTGLDTVVLSPQGQTFFARKVPGSLEKTEFAARYQ